jgi:hypothetical protein
LVQGSRRHRSLSSLVGALAAAVVAFVVVGGTAAAASHRSGDVRLGVTWAVPKQVTLGSTYSFTVTLKNSGTDTSDPTKLDLRLDVDYERLVSSAPSQGTCSFTTPWLSCQLGALGSNQSAELRITVRAAAGGGANHQIAALGGGISQADAGFFVTYVNPHAKPPPKPAEVAVSLHVSPAHPKAYTVMRFVSRIVNRGPGTAKKVTFTEPMEYIAERALSDSTSAGSCKNPSGNLVTCAVGDMRPGAVVTVVVRTCNRGTTMTEVVYARGKQPDPKPKNNSSRLFITAQRGTSTKPCRY